MVGKRKVAAAKKGSGDKKRSRDVPSEPKAEPASENHISEPSALQNHIAEKNGSTSTVKGNQPAKRRRTEPAEASLPKIPILHSQAGRVYVCGQGDSGQLGMGNQNEEDDMGEVSRPSHSPLSNDNPQVVQVVAGGMHSVALTKDGAVYTTGVNDEAALGRKTDTALYKDVKGQVGDAFKWGKVEISSEHGKVVQVSAGDSHTAALTELGAVYSWGVFRGNSGPFAFLPGTPFALEPELVYTPQSAQSQIVQISSGADHVLAMRRDGSVLTWGFGEQGQLGRLGSRMRNPEETMLQPGLVPLHKIQGIKGRTAKAAGISAGTFGSFVITTSGHTLAFGVNASGQLGFTATDGKVEDNLVPRPKLIGSLEGRTVTQIGAGKAHTLALTKEGEVLSFGLQTYGRLGRKEANTSSDKPLGPGIVELPGEDRVIALGAGSDTSALVTASGDGYVFGLGTNKQLTKVNDDDAELPFKVKKEKFTGGSAVSKILQIAMGGQHTLLLVE